ncbi:hypothetical protein EDD16DRAFT_1516105 [Pisolithus croceorrhizus]|nr:hypothetical protein EDD16DRAFT_1516105 [Pisolithus croceorrhizus]
MSTYSFPSARTSEFQIPSGARLLSPQRKQKHRSDDVPNDEPVIKKVDAATNRVLVAVVREESYAGVPQSFARMYMSTELSRNKDRRRCSSRCMSKEGEREWGAGAASLEFIGCIYLGRILLLRCLRFVGDANNDPIHTERQISLCWSIPNATRYVGIPCFYGPSDIPFCSASLMALLPVAYLERCKREYDWGSHEVDNTRSDVAYVAYILSDGPSGESRRKVGIGAQYEQKLWSIAFDPYCGLRKSLIQHPSALFDGLPEGMESPSGLEQLLCGQRSNLDELSDSNVMGSPMERPLKSALRLCDEMMHVRR